MGIPHCGRRSLLAGDGPRTFPSLREEFMDALVTSLAFPDEAILGLILFGLFDQAYITGFVSNTVPGTICLRIPAGDHRLFASRDAGLSELFFSWLSYTRKIAFYGAFRMEKRMGHFHFGGLVE